MKFSSGLLFVLAASLCMSSVLGFTARVNSPENLNVRSAPNTRSGVVSLIPPGAQFEVGCQVNGDTISGNSGTTSTWYHVPSRGGYVSGAFVSTGGQNAPGCGNSGPGVATANAGSETLNVRSSPSSHAGFVGSIGARSQFNVDCKTTGETISGNSGTTNVWYHVPAKGGYVSGAFVSTSGNFPDCSNVPQPSSDCAAGLRNPRSCSEAVAWAEAHLTNSYNSEYAGLCDHFVGLCYGRSASGFDTAFIHWQTTPERFKHYDRNPPAGALVFFKTSAAGHATISTGGGNLISTDINGRGTLGRTSISGIERQWGAPYLGWTNPYFHND